MLARKLWNLFEEKLFPVPSTELLFNQYGDVDLGLDRPGGDGIRRGNLENYLASFPARPPVLVVGEAPGPWGCRFSGVPFTGEVQLCEGALPFAGAQSSTAARPYTERSGSLFWRTMLRHHPGFFVWNCVPIHPHKAGMPLSVRNPVPREVLAFCELLEGLCSILQPERTIAVGRVAERSLREIGMKSTYVRHPSQGGAQLFMLGMKALFDSASRPSL